MIANYMLGYAIGGAFNAMLFNAFVSPELKKKLNVTTLRFNATLFILWPIFIGPLLMTIIFGRTDDE